MLRFQFVLRELGLVLPARRHAQRAADREARVRQKRGEVVGDDDGGGVDGEGKKAALTAARPQKVPRSRSIAGG